MATAENLLTNLRLSQLRGFLLIALVFRMERYIFKIFLLFIIVWFISFFPSILIPLQISGVREDAWDFPLLPVITYIRSNTQEL
jgi:hypothetical protein